MGLSNDARRKRVGEAGVLSDIFALLEEVVVSL
jgi:hypothetical protein